MTRYIAHISFETTTPLKVGSNNKDFLQDSPIQRDWNGLPMILGSSLAGVLRHDFKQLRGEKATNKLFGSESGSRVIVSNALLLDEYHRVSESLMLKKSKFLQLFSLPLSREHTAITHQGIVKSHSKFNEEIIFKGARFKFRIEVLERDNISQKEAFFTLLDLLSSSTFRLGSGSTKGRGKIKILSIEYDELCEQSQEYAALPCSLNVNLKQSYFSQINLAQNYTHYRLKLKPDNFFLFGCGGGDEEADHIGLSEACINYEAQSLSEKKIIIPASSVKGALSHRTSFHYHALRKIYIDEHLELLKKGENLAVSEIFGLGKGEAQSDTKGNLRGKIIISDVFLESVSEKNTKLFNHLKIDQFTGGGIEGALFQEKANKVKSITLDIWLEHGISNEAITAFEYALRDIIKGTLPLGGASSKGHGYFSGSIKKNGEDYDISSI